jgi:hypothetical protein
MRKRMIEKIVSNLLYAFSVFLLLCSCSNRESNDNHSFVSFKKIFGHTSLVNSDFYPQDTSSVTIICNIDGNCSKCIGRMVVIDSTILADTAFRNINVFFLVNAANKYGLQYLIKQGVSVKNPILFFPSDSVEYSSWCSDLLKVETSVVKNNRIIQQLDFSGDKIKNIINQLKKE